MYTINISYIKNKINSFVTTIFIKIKNSLRNKLINKKEVVLTLKTRTTSLMMGDNVTTKIKKVLNH